jgi:hypothetical protein
MFYSSVKNHTEIETTMYCNLCMYCLHAVYTESRIEHVLLLQDIFP